SDDNGDPEDRVPLQRLAPVEVRGCLCSGIRQLDHRIRRISVMRQASSSRTNATKRVARSGMVVPRARVVQLISPNARAGSPPTVRLTRGVAETLSRSPNTRRSTAAA